MLDPKLKPYWKSKEICLKSGEWVKLSPNQMEWLTEAIIYVPVENWGKTKLKVGGTIFTLNDIEDNVENIRKHKQISLDL